MANRAYLFSSDSNCNWKDYNDYKYFDSRHNIPLAWWFLFGGGDVRLINVKEGEDWQEVRFSANKLAALTALQSRQDLLLQIVGTTFNRDLLLWFVDTVNAWPGTFLLMNPWEVLQGDKDDYEPCLQIVRSIHSATPDVERVVEAASRFSRVDFADCDEEKIMLDVIGYTY